MDAPKPIKTENTLKEELLHYSVGAIIAQNGRFLLIDRVKIPYGFACPAGHINNAETPEQALKRETKEETNLDITKFKLLSEEELEWNYCSRGAHIHHWYLFLCEASGEVKKSDDEAKTINWFTREEIRKLKLEPVWEYWLKKFFII